jgi:hypothetical protein
MRTYSLLLNSSHVLCRRQANRQQLLAAHFTIHTARFNIWCIHHHQAIASTPSAATLGALVSDATGLLHNRQDSELLLLLTNLVMQFMQAKYHSNLNAEINRAASWT